jgi:hypothetical protein
MTWSEGDLFILPASSSVAIHSASSDTAIYWVTDEPLLAYLGNYYIISRPPLPNPPFTPPIYKKKGIYNQLIYTPNLYF